MASDPQLVAPARGGGFPVEPVLEVVDQQRLDIGRVAVDLLVVGLATERHERTGHHVHEAPDELLERRRLAFRRQLARDAGGDLGDAREAAHRVVARRDLRMAEVEHEELPARPARSASANTRRSRSTSPLGSKTITTSPRRMSWAISSSARRVLPTRVVPSTSVCPTRSSRSIQISLSSGSTPWMPGSPPTPPNLPPARTPPTHPRKVRPRSSGRFTGSRASYKRWV
jgi:hypothetical protein